MIDTVRVEVTDAGVLYVAPLVVLLVNVPHAEPLQPVLDIVHVTPLLAESFETVAVKATVCPSSREVWADGERATLIAGVLLLPLLPPPQAAKSDVAAKITRKRFISRWPPEPGMICY